MSASLMGRSCWPYSAFVEGVMSGAANFWSFLSPFGQSMPYALYATLTSAAFDWKWLLKKA